MTSGLVATSILRILAIYPRTLSQLQDAMPDHPSPQVTTAVGKLRAKGLVTVKLKRLTLTRSGRAAAPSGVVDLAKLHGTYKPPKVVRRIGTEVHKRLPSMRGGRLFYQEQA